MTFPTHSFERFLEHSFLPFVLNSTEHFRRLSARHSLQHSLPIYLRFQWHPLLFSQRSTKKGKNKYFKNNEKIKSKKVLLLAKKKNIPQRKYISLYIESEKFNLFNSYLSWTFWWCSWTFRHSTAFIHFNKIHFFSVCLILLLWNWNEMK